MNGRTAARRPGLAQWLLAALASALALAACGRDYPQDSPDAVLAAARRMVQEQRADLLPDLIYAESPDMRKLLNQLGQTLGSLQDLALAVQKAYPEEIAKLKAEAEEAARKGEASSFIQRMAAQAAPQRGRRGRRGQGVEIKVGTAAAGDEDPRKLFDNAAKELFADPYGWLTKTEERLTVQKIADDSACLMWDGKPALGVGIMMKEEKGKWYIVLPTTMPGVGNILPKSPETWEIMGGLVQVFDNTLTDLTADVRKGRCPRLEDLASKAGEKAFLPAVLVIFAYGQALEAEKKEQKAKAAAAAPTAPTGAAAATGK